MRVIFHRVGPACPNVPSDVRIVQELLATHPDLLHPLSPPPPNGILTDQTAKAIRMFQVKGVGMRHPDGIVSPHGITLLKLNMSRLGQKLPNGMSKKQSPGSAKNGTLTDADYTAAATALGCDVAAIKAVAQVETKRTAFDSKGRPALLFERQYFHRLTSGKYDKSHADISNAKPYVVYGTFAQQYDRLDDAAKLDKDAAWQSASWGMFQIMGENYKQAGFSSIAAFVTAMQSSESAHLNAFVDFIKNGPAMLKALREHDWTTFARHYNGPDFKKYNYDTKLAAAYQQLTQASVPTPPPASTATSTVPMRQP
jgi:hypothetical protein